MTAEDNKLAKEIKESFGGSLLSKLLFGLSWLILLPLLTCPFWRIEDYDPQSKTIVKSRWPWEIVLGFIIAWFCTAYGSYLLAKRAKNRLKNEIR